MTRSKKTIYVDGIPLIGKEASPFIIAEIGTNHGRNLATARSMIEGLVDTGCDCVKFQIYEPDEIVSGAIMTKDYGLENVYGDISAAEMFEQYLKTPKEWFPELIDLAHGLGLKAAATIHGNDGVEWAKTQKLDFIKIASMDHTNLPLLENLVDKITLPILISFGMAELEDIDRAMEVLKHHRPGVGLFYCVAIYPPGPRDIALGNIKYLADRFGVPVGFSDHTTNIATAGAALACGATFFEKHVTHDRTAPGPDHPFALELSEFSEYVRTLHEIHGFLGYEGFRTPSERERGNRKHYLKSIIAKHNKRAGEVLSADDVYLARPGTGIPPRFLKVVVNAVLSRDICAEKPLEWQDIGRDQPFES